MRRPSTATQAAAREQARPVVWWGRDFPGGTDQVREARHWVEDLLPGCEPLADILLLTSELCTNAVTHTRSGQAGGRFSVHVEWTPDAARVVVGDQGSPATPAIGARSGETAWTDESGRGLWLVDELAGHWGTACHLGRRWVWADLQWEARGGPPLRAPGRTDAAVTGIAAMRAAFPGTTIWWGHLTGAWRAAVPGATAGGLLSSPTLGSLCRVLAEAYPCRERPSRTLLALIQPEPSGKGTDMTTARCACGFTELADETITDHLLVVFEPDDRKGIDGLVHEEGGRLACVCGVTASTPDDLDEHFLKAFTPGDAIGRDGVRHEATDGG